MFSNSEMVDMVTCDIELLEHKQKKLLKELKELDKQILDKKLLRKRYRKMEDVK